MAPGTVVQCWMTLLRDVFKNSGDAGKKVSFILLNFVLSIRYAKTIWLGTDRDIVSMLTYFQFRKAGCSANQSGGFRQISIIPHPPDHPAYRGSIHWKPTGARIADHLSGIVNMGPVRRTICRSRSALM
jgi:hypothetical protein